MLLYCHYYIWREHVLEDPSLSKSKVNLRVTEKVKMGSLAVTPELWPLAH